MFSKTGITILSTIKISSSRIRKTHTRESWAN